MNTTPTSDDLRAPCAIDGRRAVLLIGLLGAIACATPVGVNPVDLGAVRHVLSADAVSANQPSISSRQVLLRLGLGGEMAADPVRALASLHARMLSEMNLGGKTTGDRLFALTEYSYLYASELDRECHRPVRTFGRRALQYHEPPAGVCERAREYYVAAATYAYAFAFPDAPRAPPNPLDPRLRTAVDLYNLSITSALQRADGAINPRSGSFAFHLGRVALDVDPAGLRYAGRRLGNLVPAARLAVRGLRNRYRQPGLGAPFLADVVGPDDGEVPLTGARIAETLRIPVTVLVRFENLSESLRSGEFRARVEIYNENRTTEVEVGGQRVPLEYETSAALAYSLEESKLWDFEITGFLHGDTQIASDGLVMLQPYQPGRIPVVLVHGTASSPARWAEMLNEYRSDPYLRERYQFWLFMYTTGNPILFSASLLRESLVRTLAEIDPDGSDPALRRMVIVGHSQGGLLTKLQVVSSGTRFWDSISDRPFDSIDMKPETRELLSKAVFFEPLPFVERVVFISTPHRGSFLAGNFLGRLASSLFTAPTRLAGMALELGRKGISLAGRAVEEASSGFGLFRDPDEELRQRLSRLPSSVDNMNPKHRFILNLQSIPVPPGVIAHSIIPVRGEPPPEGQDDGVVEYSSAHIDEARSEYVVYGSFHSVQSNPEAIQELRRILLEHAGAPRPVPAASAGPGAPPRP